MDETQEPKTWRQKLFVATSLVEVGVLVLLLANVPSRAPIGGVAAFVMLVAAIPVVAFVAVVLAYREKPHGPFVTFSFWVHMLFVAGLFVAATGDMWLNPALKPSRQRAGTVRPVHRHA